MNKVKKIWNVLLLAAMMLVWVCGASVTAEGLSGDNSLYSLGITTEGAEVSPEFLYSTIEYNVTVPQGTSRLELDPVTSNENASIISLEGQDLGEDGTTTVRITVQAENGDQVTYYLYVKTGEDTAAAAEQEPETEVQTEAETEPETEDPRYVRVERSSLEQADATISSLKEEVSVQEERVERLTMILYGMIALCVVLLFVVINLLLKNRERKKELQSYEGFGDYPSGQPYREMPEERTEEKAEKRSRKKKAKKQKAETEQAPEQSYEEPLDFPVVEEPKKAEKPVANDDPATVPKPSKARKKQKPMPEYEAPKPEHEYQVPDDAAKEDGNVEINMIDL